MLAGGAGCGSYGLSVPVACWHPMPSRSLDSGDPEFRTTPGARATVRASHKDSVDCQCHPGQIGPVRRSVRHDQPPIQYSAEHDGIQICVR